MAINGSLRERFTRVSLFSLACLFAFLAIWGPWGLKLYQLTGNPFFPMFNSVFHSSWISPSSFMDKRFLPKDIFEALFYPFYWANSQRMTVMEPHFVDYRFAVVFILIILWLLLFLQKRLSLPWKVIWDTRYGIKPCDGIILFALISFIIWEVLFSILRYAVVIEAILGLIILRLVAGIILLFRNDKNRIKFSLVFSLILIPLIFVLFTTKYPGWSRVAYTSHVFKINAKSLPDRSLVIFIGKPLAYLAPFLARDAQNTVFIGLTDMVLSSSNYHLGALFRKKIRGWNGPIYFVARKETLNMAKQLENYGLFPCDNCSRITSNIDADAYLCPVVKISNVQKITGENSQG